MQGERIRGERVGRAGLAAAPREERRDDEEALGHGGYRGGDGTRGSPGG